jgi:molecular chaperone DnaK
MAAVRDPIVGVDLGTSNTVIAACDDGGAPQVLADDHGATIQPSVVSFHPSGRVIVGAEAKQRRIVDPRHTVYSVKRLIGRPYGAPEIAVAQRRTPFAIKEGANQQPVIHTRAGEFAIPEISAIVLDHVRTIAETALGTEIRRAVITVPANFVEGQRSATATAGAIAGLTVVRVLNEPTAAALAYGHHTRLDGTIAVYDFGGGTFDVTVLRLDHQVYEVLGTAGDSFLGGDDLDERLVDHMVAAFLADQRVDLRDHELAMMRLRAVAEQTKIELSRRPRAIVKIDEIAYGAGGAPLDLELEITRDQFVEQIADIVDRTFPVCDEALRLAGCDPSAIDEVVLVGGTTKVPHVRARVNAFFAKEARTDVDPEEAIAVGAALQAETLQRALGRASATRGVRSPGERAASRGASVDPIPANLPGASRSPLPELPPASADSRAPILAAPPASPQIGDVEPARQILEVTPRGLGVGTVAGYCEALIRRNARLPTEVTRNFTTSRDRQDTVRIRVCQGESRRIDDNVVLGDLVLEGLEPRPRGETTIEVTFTIDVSGILQVRARDPRTGTEKGAALDVHGAQSPAEVDAARRRLRELRS